jgi:hypothetical protein
MKLFRVTLKGMKMNSTGITYGISYVVAESMDKAYEKVRNFLDGNDIGFRKDREVETIELIADSYRFNDVGTLLFL